MTVVAEFVCAELSDQISIDNISETVLSLKKNVNFAEAFF